ncbi:MAG: UDP-N-acetylglucosamine--N-acetylmuramyl-(pentapeptide) pyrophosphoryl-undecaprenol N-acetylglucosamine transferase [Clostridia bacterium]|nr:UDP-N-acetylglucosamine--N-acetylmuramyl-(pentapeptide) pyrophosphoryl-undecaprenol N-acetylglucosamine transferase [Clostridia bacterium]
MKKILFCGGGSAGHVMPNIALIKSLNGKYIVEYAGTDGIERDICRLEGVKYHTFDGVKLVRGKIFANLALPFKLRRAVKQARRILIECKPDAVFCKGGYASLPPALAAKRENIPVFTHESDLSLGLANKIISKISVKTFTSFPETAEKIKNGMYTGSPLRQGVLCGDGRKIRESFNNGKKTILVFGGGGGSEAINRNLRKVIPELCKKYNILHICGKGNVVQSNVNGYKQTEFTDDIGSFYAAADCAVARSGSNSAFEVIANRVPALFIPLENRASRGDQLQNAEYFYKRGLCHILRQKDIAPERLLKEIEATANDENLKLKLESCKIQNGNEAIIKEIEKVLSD